jgi:hypothetical protein
MQVSKQLTLGLSKYTITGTGEDFHAACMDLDKVSIYDLGQCGLCGSELLRLSAYKTLEGGFKYIKVACAKCRGSLTLGEAKNTHANYYRKNDAGKLDWQEFKGKDDKNTNPKPHPEKITAKAMAGKDVEW